MADSIINLPVDETPELPEDATIVNKYIVTEQQKEGVKRLFNCNRDILIATAIFFGLSLPLTDDLLAKVYPACAESPMYRLGIKSLLFLISVFIINNLPLMRKA